MNSLRTNLLPGSLLVGALALMACGDDDATTATTATGGAGGAGSGGNQQGGTGGGTGGEGGEVQGDPPDWTCLGSVTWDSPAGATATYTVTYEDFITGEVLPNLTAKLCARADTVCATPLDEQMGDENGTVVLTVPLGTDGFDGFVEVTGENVAWVSIFHKPLTEDEEFSEGIVTNSGLVTIAALLSATVDEADGQLLFGVNECGPGDPSGATVTATNQDADTLLGYIRNELPRADVDDTDETGFGAFVNLPPGPTTITATVNATGELIATADIVTRAGFVTYVALPPSPR